MKSDNVRERGLAQRKPANPKRAYIARGLAQRKPASPSLSMRLGEAHEREGARYELLRANEGSVMLPRGRGEAENRACEGLGFAEVLRNPSRFRSISIEMARFR